MAEKAVKPNGTLIATVGEERLEWVKRSAKAGGKEINVSEFVRAMIDYLRDSSPKEITSKLAKSRLEAEMRATDERIREATELKAKLERELEKVGV